MGGIAALARSAGHRVTGSDQAVYPPMSNQLEALGIELIDGFDVAQLDLNPDVVIVGNIMSRGMPIVEAILNQRVPYTSGPAWLAEHVLRDRHVIAISGTHGKTTTASMTAWLLERAGYNPGFLIGGVPANFATTARLGGDQYFVIEADEYDTAFFDKRAKFMHYDPQTLVINNLEFDHADIYKDMDAIIWQFHQLLRMLPGDAKIIANAVAPEIARLLEMGSWTPVTTFSAQSNADADCLVQSTAQAGMSLAIGHNKHSGPAMTMPGQHNLENAAAAVLAAQHVGIDPQDSLTALADFRGVKRRFELLGTFAGVRIFDDFAHHPTAIRQTLEACKQSAKGRVLAVLEPRSNSMKLGAHRSELSHSLTAADRSWVFQPSDLSWNLKDTFVGQNNVEVLSNIESIVSQVTKYAAPDDDIIVMSNGGFSGIHELLSAALGAEVASPA